MRRLDAIVFDFDGVIADCRLGRLLPGAKAFVRATATAVPLAIASGASTGEIESVLQELRQAFVAIVGADQTVRSKPSPDPYLEALNRIRAAGYPVEASRVIAIDDSVWGLVAARTAGLCCVGVATPARAADLAPHAELVVGGIDLLTLDMLERLVGARFDAR